MDTKSLQDALFLVVLEVHNWLQRSRNDYFVES